MKYFNVIPSGTDENTDQGIKNNEDPNDVCDILSVNWHWRFITIV